MKLPMILKEFGRDQEGAVTVDWVVLTAGIVGLGLVVISAMASAISDNATTIAGDVTAAITSTPGY